MTEQANEPVKPTARKKTIRVVFGAIAVGFAALFIFLFVQKHAASIALRQYTDALIAGNYEQAYSLTTTDFKAATSEAEFLRQQSVLSDRLGRLMSASLGPSETVGNQDGWSANISATFKFERGEREFDFALKKDHDTWAVHGYQEQ